MKDILKTKKYVQAKKKAKELEKRELLSMKEVVNLYKEGIEDFEKFIENLKPEWFIRDVHKASKEKKRAVRRKDSG